MPPWGRMLLMWTVALAAWPALAKDTRPTVIIFLADDLGYGDLGCYGHLVIQTLHLDRFAKKGTRFPQAYAAAPVCSPSRAAILTGRTPYRTGVFTWIRPNSFLHLRSSEIALPKLLRQAGYCTCHVLKWHLNGSLFDAKQPQPPDHGYDWWFATYCDAQPSHRNPENFVRNGKRVGKLKGYSALLIVEEAINWLRVHRDRTRPFFLTVWTHEPHAPIESAPEFLGLYPELRKKDPNQAQHHANVSQLDHAFKTLMLALDELGQPKSLFAREIGNCSPTSLSPISNCTIFASTRKKASTWLTAMPTNFASSFPDGVVCIRSSKRKARTGGRATKGTKCSCSACGVAEDKFPINLRGFS